MPEIVKDMEALKGRVNKLENIAYILGGLAIVLGLAGASLYTMLSNARQEAGELQGSLASLSEEIDAVLKTKADTVLRDRLPQVVKDLGTPVDVQLTTSKFEVPVGSKTTTAKVTCPQGTRPVGGGFKNYRSAVNLVQMYTEQRDVFLSLDNNGKETFVVDAWAACLRATEGPDDTAG